MSAVRELEFVTTHELIDELLRRSGTLVVAWEPTLLDNKEIDQPGIIFGGSFCDVSNMLGAVKIELTKRRSNGMR